MLSDVYGCKNYESFESFFSGDCYTLIVKPHFVVSSKSIYTNISILIALRKSIIRKEF